VAVAAAKVITGREGPAGALDDDAVHVAIVVGLPDRLAELGQHPQRERVELVRAVEGDPGASALLFVDQAFKVRHRGLR